MKPNTVLRKLLLLAPAGASIPPSLSHEKVSTSAKRYDEYLCQMQRLRGRVYLEDGAIQERQLTDGRHVAESDRASWHLLVLDREGKTCGCVRYRDHGEAVEFSDLTAAQSSLASCPEWGARMRAAVREELLLAQALALPFIEIGGWALDAAIRGTAEALRMVMGAYALSREFGGAVGLATATVRHSSASILRRIGGQPLEHDGQTVPAYLDPQYGCEMELLRFHSWALNPRFDAWIEQMAEEIRNAAVICAPQTAPVVQNVPTFVDKLRQLRLPLSPVAQPVWE